MKIIDFLNQLIITPNNFLNPWVRLGCLESIFVRHPSKNNWLSKSSYSQVKEFIRFISMVSLSYYLAFAFCLVALTQAQTNQTKVIKQHKNRLFNLIIIFTILCGFWFKRLSAIQDPIYISNLLKTAILKVPTMVNGTVQRSR